jgi:hypothetical protein
MTEGRSKEQDGTHQLILRREKRTVPVNKLTGPWPEPRATMRPANDRHGARLYLIAQTLSIQTTPFSGATPALWLTRKPAIINAKQAPVTIDGDEPTWTNARGGVHMTVHYRVIKNGIFVGREEDLLSFPLSPREEP